MNDGGPAFPALISADPKYTCVAPGMSLRDWFAGQALQGLLAAVKRRDATVTEEEMARIFSEVSYKFAAAMLAERAKGTS